MAKVHQNVLFMIKNAGGEKTFHDAGNHVLVALDDLVDMGLIKRTSKTYFTYKVI